MQIQTLPSHNGSFLDVLCLFYLRDRCTRCGTPIKEDKMTHKETEILRNYFYNESIIGMSLIQFRPNSLTSQFADLGFLYC